ncbi:MAG TPA: universal stress protein [Beijerinckiaceae bacterium]|nr:universal stress protein [Beijerinckiaceae bacterium]
MFKTILVPVDLAETEASALAIERATQLADAGDGTIRLVFVRSIIPTSWTEYIPPHFDEAQQNEAEERLAAMAATIPLPAERVSSVVQMGSVYSEVLQEADRIAADLVVIGSHRPSMTTYLLGSNASTIVRHAKCSVLVVRA